MRRAEVATDRSPAGDPPRDGSYPRTGDDGRVGLSIEAYGSGYGGAQPRDWSFAPL